MNTTGSLRVVLAAVGSRGDVQPMLALAQAFAARGHVPVIAAPPDFGDWVRSLGFEFAPVGSDIQAFLASDPGVMTGNPFKAAAAGARYFKSEIPQQFTQLRQVCRGADAIVWAGLAAVAPSVAESLGLPVLATLFTTCMIPSDLHPPPTVPRHGMPRWVNRLLWGLDRVFAQRLLGVPLNAARATVGLPPVRLREHLLQHGRLVFAVDETVLPPDPKWDPQAIPYANYIYFDDPRVLDPELEAWLDAGEPPVFIGFGSMSGEGTGRMDSVIVEAMAAVGKRCIVGAGWAGLGGSTLPAGWRVVRDVPHQQLFPRMAAVVHHGGSGTTAQALRAGVPQVILPLLLDQYHHAHRLALAGLAPKAKRMEHITAPELAAAIQAALALPPGPRTAVAGRLRGSDGRGQVVQRVEALAGA